MNVDKQLASIRFLSCSPEWEDLMDFLRDTLEINTILENVSDTHMREWVGARNVYLLLHNTAKSKNEAITESEEII